jgi:hypothetical protein
MNSKYYVNEFNQALNQENERRKKDGLAPIESNIKFIDCTIEVRKELEEFNNKLRKERREEIDKELLVLRAANRVYQFGNKFTLLNFSINYRVNKINTHNKIINFENIDEAKRISTIKHLNKLSEKCNLLLKKYANISRKIEKEQLETCEEESFKKYVEKKDILEFENISKEFTKIWNQYVRFFNKLIDENRTK